MIFVFVLCSIIIGAMMPIQAGINAELTRFIKHPYLAGVISLIVGALALGLILLVQGIPIQEIKRLSDAPPRLFLGGILSALFVSSSMILIPRMGATAMVAAFITGQLLMSVIMDHYGLFGLTQNSISVTRVLGVILLFAGLFLVIKKAA